MKEKINEELVKIIDSVGKNEYMIYKIDSSIFVRESKLLIENAVNTLKNLLNNKATEKDLKKYENQIVDIISKYKNKLELIYSEIYCQYTTIQNELQEASLNQRISTIAYQKLVNDNSKNVKEIIDKKFIIKMKNRMHKKVVEVCNKKIVMCQKNLKVEVEKISKLFEDYTSKKFKNYVDLLNEINNKIENIDEKNIINVIREETIDFVTRVLLVKEIKVNK